MRQHKLGYFSSYDRGLSYLLYMWADIKAQVPDAELHIAYGWDMFDIVTHGNPERQAWKKSMEVLMQQDGITQHGRISKKELKKLRKECGIWAYPADFVEINCITALDCQNDGCVPVVMNLGALEETVQSGVKVDGNITDLETLEVYKMHLLDMMDDVKRWKDEQAKGREFVKKFDWKDIAKSWIKAMNAKTQDTTKVSIVTPTIRRGFWNLMADNIAGQSHKIHEWIIVDDYKKDRAHIARKYAKEYDINIVYVRGKERKVQRHFALASANNTALEHVTGDLMVILQDFILMPEDGIAQLVRVHRTHPTALIAPVDEYYAPSIKPDTESEDWFHGETEVVGEFMRANIRINGEGLRQTDHPFDFEQNYCAIPVETAKALGGWYEFMDEGLGFDNTEFAWRALILGYDIYVDEFNVARCIDHWEALKGTPEHGEGREFRLNDPRYFFEQQMVERNLLPLKRTQEIDDKIELYYTFPKTVTTPQEANDWIQNKENLAEIVSLWLRQYENLDSRV